MQRLESFVFALLALVGLWLHVPAATSEFGRGFDGFQGAVFSSAAVNYERLRLAPSIGFPLFHVDPTGAPKTWNLYANHPRFVPQLAWWSLRTFGPIGWSTRPGPVPSGTEAAVRAPFFAFQIASWLLVGGIAALAAGRRAGFVALVLAICVPIGFPFAGLVNYEHPSIVFVLAGALFAVLATRQDRLARAFAIAAGGICGAGALVTYAPVLFVPALALIVRRNRVALVAAGAATSVAALIPHMLASHAVQTRLHIDAPSIIERMRALMAPMFDGTLPPARWLAAQWSAAQWSFGPALMLVATLGAAGVVALFVHWRRVRAATSAPADASRAAPTSAGEATLARVTVALGLGALAVQVLYWRHTGDPQECFMLNAAPAVVLCATFAWSMLVRHTRGALAAVVGGLVPVALVAASATQGLNLALADRAPGPADLPGASGTLALLPRTAGDELAHLLPGDAVGWYPGELGWTPAVSYYAWRPLLPVARGQYDAMPSAANALGLLERPVWLVLPRDPVDAGLRSASDGLESDVEAFLGRPLGWVEGPNLRAAAFGN